MQGLTASFDPAEQHGRWCVVLYQENKGGCENLLWTAKPAAFLFAPPQVSCD